MSNTDFTVIGTVGDPVARMNLVLCFFGKTKAEPWCDAGLAALRAWSAQVPELASSWLALGANASMMTSGGPTAMAKCIKQLEAGRNRDSRINAALARGPQKYGADFAFNWVYLAAAADPDASESNLLEMHFAHNHLARVGEEQFVQWARQVAESVPFDSGYAGLSWSSCKESTETEAGHSLGAFALHHPGYDVANNGATHFEIGSRCRGVQWLVFVGKQLMQRTASVAKLRAAVPQGQVCELRAGAMVQTSAGPVIGDVNKRQPGPNWAELAKLLEPSTFFGDYTLDILFNDDEDLRGRCG